MRRAPTADRPDPPTRPPRQRCARSPAHPASSLRFDTYVDDAAAWLRHLRADRRFASAGVLGHSEGSLVAMAATERVLTTLEAGRTTDSTPPALAMLFRPSVQPYLVSWLRYDPAAVVARLRAPVLVVQGTTDVQTDTSDARRLAAASPRATLRMIDGINHVLKRVPADRAAQVASYSDPALPVEPALMDAVAAFVQRPPR